MCMFVRFAAYIAHNLVVDARAVLVRDVNRLVGSRNSEDEIELIVWYNVLVLLVV